MRGDIGHSLISRKLALASRQGWNLSQQIVIPSTLA